MDTNMTSQAILSAAQTGGDAITTAIVGLWQHDEMLFTGGCGDSFPGWLDPAAALPTASRPAAATQGGN